jgi:hypothetical protein
MGGPSPSTKSGKDQAGLEKVTELLNFLAATLACIAFRSLKDTRADTTARPAHADQPGRSC